MYIRGLRDDRANPYRRNDHRLEKAHNGTSRIARSTTKDDQIDDQNAPFTSV